MTKIKIITIVVYVTSIVLFMLNTLYEFEYLDKGYMILIDALLIIIWIVSVLLAFIFQTHIAIYIVFEISLIFLHIKFISKLDMKNSKQKYLKIYLIALHILSIILYYPSANKLKDLIVALVSV